ncbi:DUF2490 domain-containing protein [Fulvivirga sp. M361]|uniref:DUF2490 domain-containing protein n=1 Tax=Fulvivirga sp. M361 TaxID=2594266 RepID=UPI001179EFDE|nr:DUF2490 domain-containing protein [Fulvivirga sp. M361]TRX54808.1 DUF2490 domain-containing protein [Fulvivirga sp. M361]
MKQLNTKNTLGLFLFVVLFQFHSKAQEVARETEYKEPVTAFWINTYGNIRVSNRLFWIAQTHFRMEEKGSTPFVGQVAQLYNRHALSYLFSKNFNVSLGGVLRVNYNTNGTSEQKNKVPEWRIWHQYLFAMPMSRMMVYHRIRVEHRWSKGFNTDSQYIFRNRWRYMFKLKMPLNKPKLSSNTFYVSPEVELIMQSGKPVIDSPLEDLRLHTSFGYILNPRITVAAGIMYSQGQDLADGNIYKQKWTTRFHVYFSPDFRKVKRKLPSIHHGD